MFGYLDHSPKYCDTRFSLSHWVFGTFLFSTIRRRFFIALLFGALVGLDSVNKDITMGVLLPLIIGVSLFPVTWFSSMVFKMFTFEFSSSCVFWLVVQVSFGTFFNQANCIWQPWILSHCSFNPSANSKLQNFPLITTILASLLYWASFIGVFFFS